MNSPFSDLKPEIITDIRGRFEALRTKDDLYDLFQSVIRELPAGETKREHFEQEIAWLYKNGYPRDYHFFKIKKTSGKDRQIASPQGPLKTVQRIIAVILSSVFQPHPHSFGFRKGSSVVDNARMHVGFHYVFNIDLADFFTSISLKRVKRSLEGSPFGLDLSREPIAAQLARICCIELIVPGANSRRAFLPQGAPSSPVLSNIVCQKMDERLNGLAKRFHLNFSRYADDITFSANHNVFREGSEFRLELADIVTASGFQINPIKTRLQRQKNRQEVTGLTVNQKVNICRKYVKELRRYLYYWERYGLTKAYELYLKDQHEFLLSGSGVPMAAIIKGKLDFLHMVKGDTGDYLKLLARFHKMDKGGPRKVVKGENATHHQEAEQFQQHQPHNVAIFLRLFQDSAGLKYLTHEFDIGDEVFNLEQTVELAGREFQAAYQKHPITRALYARIKQFAFEKNPKWWRWQDGKMREINLGWSAPSVRTWAQKFPGTHPMLLLPYREEMILPFKESIRIRAPKLKELINANIKAKFREAAADWDVELNDLERADIYTDVDMLLGGIRHLLDGILERGEVSRKLLITYRKTVVSGREMKMIEIIHTASICYKDAAISELLNGNFLEAKNAFYGLCNWSVTAIFNDGAYRLNILKDDVDMPEREAVMVKVLGFTHHLYFY
ncbi:RNA-directed DNA polymerase [Mucilaginibacter rigui]|uniref:RNA-directed DNA polymerase n=1 Tax=Mucilaginibacter rigui TaxID=534635 RepID=A0ABR7X5M9_9SPHI|nr:reverse transcriptase family protein [Mucilaginibacter rigui]MBD1385898.1 RNA-directed DNA polymerase [Mucilaginibacter rigui]